MMLDLLALFWEGDAAAASSPEEDEMVLDSGALAWEGDVASGASSPEEDEMILDLLALVRGGDVVAAVLGTSSPDAMVLVLLAMALDAASSSAMSSFSSMSWSLGRSRVKLKSLSESDQLCLEVFPPTFVSEPDRVFTLPGPPFSNSCSCSSGPPKPLLALFRGLRLNVACTFAMI